MSGRHRSAVIVARALGVEGYSDFVHNQVELYWKHVVMDPHRANSVATMERKFSKLIAELDLTDKERLTLGRFISLRAQMSFDTGLRVGMQAFAHENDKDIET